MKDWKEWVKSVHNIPSPFVEETKVQVTSTSELLEYYVSRAKILDVIEPNINRLKSEVESMNDNPWNHEEGKLRILNEVENLLNMWERQTGGGKSI